MHLCFTPITSEGRLSAKEILGYKDKLSLWQDKFYAHMSAKYPELERGISSKTTGRKHIPVWLFKKAKRLNGLSIEIELLYLMRESRKRKQSKFYVNGSRRHNTLLLMLHRQKNISDHWKRRTYHSPRRMIWLPNSWIKWNYNYWHLKTRWETNRDCLIEYL